MSTGNVVSVVFSAGGTPSKTPSSGQPTLVCTITPASKQRRQDADLQRLRRLAEHNSQCGQRPEHGSEETASGRSSSQCPEARMMQPSDLMAAALQSGPAAAASQLVQQQIGASQEPDSLPQADAARSSAQDGSALPQEPVSPTLPAEPLCEPTQLLEPAAAVGTAPAEPSGTCSQQQPLPAPATAAAKACHVQAESADAAVSLLLGKIAARQASEGSKACRITPSSQTGPRSPASASLPASIQHRRQLARQPQQILLCLQRDVRAQEPRAHSHRLPLGQTKPAWQSSLLSNPARHSKQRSKQGATLWSLPQIRCRHHAERSRSAMSSLQVVMPSRLHLNSPAAAQPAWRLQTRQHTATLSQMQVARRCTTVAPPGCSLALQARLRTSWLRSA